VRTHWKMNRAAVTTQGHQQGRGKHQTSIENHMCAYCTFWSKGAMGFDIITIIGRARACIPGCSGWLLSWVQSSKFLFCTTFRALACPGQYMTLHLHSVT
jgi:hypothetical protein